MKKNIIILAFLFITVLVSSQNKKNILYKCSYVLTYLPDSSNVEDYHSEEMILLTSNKTSKFLSLGTYLRDSISKNIDRTNINSLNLMTLFSNVPKTKFKEKIFKNFSKNKITITEKVFRDNFKYLDSLKLYKWEIINESKIISGYNCKKAKTSYAGRDFTAWYTDEIPISDGPYKFNGLPGLIIQISDTENHYDYTLINFKKYNLENISIIPEDDNYIITTKKEFIVTKKEFYSNIFQKLEQGGITLNLDSPTQKKEILNKLKKQNNPIELNIK